MAIQWPQLASNQTLYVTGCKPVRAGAVMMQRTKVRLGAGILKGGSVTVVDLQAVGNRRGRVAPITNVARGRRDVVIAVGENHSTAVTAGRWVVKDIEHVSWAAVADFATEIVLRADKDDEVGSDGL